MLCNQYKPCCAASLEIRDWSLVTGSLLDVCVCVCVGGEYGIGRCGSFNERNKNMVNGRKGRERFS